MKIINIFLSLNMLFLFGCFNKNTNTTHSTGEIGLKSTVERGFIVSMLEVEIEGKEGDLGQLSGGVIGGVAGSTIGGGRGQIVGAAIGATIGILVGGKAQKAITSGTAINFLIKLENSEIISIIQSNENNLRVGDSILIITTGRTSRLILDK